MKCSVFIATSVDGYIANQEGGVDWLETAGNSNVDMGKKADMGFSDFMASVDCIIMGRKCMEKISSFNLTPQQWPYGKTRIFVISNTVKHPPENLEGKVKMVPADIPALMTQLKKDGYQHVYVDGGTTITSFINLNLINELTITQAPILLGEGKPLFGHILKNVTLSKAQAVAFPNDFIQFKYTVA